MDIKGIYSAMTFRRDSYQSLPPIHIVGVTQMFQRRQSLRLYLPRCSFAMIHWVLRAYPVWPQTLRQTVEKTYSLATIRVLC